MVILLIRSMLEGESSFSGIRRVPLAEALAGLSGAFVSESGMVQLVLAVFKKCHRVTSRQG